MVKTVERDRDMFALIQAGIESTIESGAIDETLLIAIRNLPIERKELLSEVILDASF